MNRIRRILAPVDLASPASALTAIRLAERFGASITFLHVIEPDALAAGFFFPKIAKAWIRRDPDPRPETPAEARLLDFLKALPLGSLPHDRRIVRGRPPHEILRAAERIRPDLLVQGSRIPEGLEEWMSGGDAWRIIRRVPCPVITVKYGRPSDRTRLSGGVSEVLPLPGLQRILCLTDFGESSRMAISEAAALCLRTGAELLLFHFLERRKRNAREWKTTRTSAEDAMERLLGEVRAMHPRIRAISRIGEGEGGDDPLRLILEGDAEMIAMGIGSLPDSLLPSGSLAERVFRRARCSLLTAGPEGVSRGLERRYRKVFRRLTPEDLIRIGDEQPELIGEDLFRGNPISRTSGLFLKHYSAAGLEKVFEEYGLFPRLREKGFEEPRVAVQIDDPYRQRLRVFFGGVEDERHLLVEAVLKEGILEGAREAESGGRGSYFPVLAVEWITMQNPRASFSPDRPPLPGQICPGLGMSREILELIALIGLRIGKDGIAIHPQYFHAAVLYHPRFKCYNPLQEGQFAALIRDTGDRNLGDVSWAIHLGCLRVKNPGSTAAWNIDRQVLALTEPLKDHFRSDRYRSLFRESLACSRYRIDWRLFTERMKERTDPLRTEDRKRRSVEGKAPGGHSRDGSPPA